MQADSLPSEAQVKSNNDYNHHYLVLTLLQASLIAQLVKNPFAMQETQVPFLGWEDLLEKGQATNSSILALRISWTV